MHVRFGGTLTPLRTLIALAAVVLGPQAHAQDRAGVITTLEGHVTVTRASLPQPAPLKFKDDIFVRDRVATGKDSVARILLGGRAVVTVREHSTVTITEAPGVATVDVGTGRVAVAVAREKMRAGDVVEVKTPNAVAGIRGTVVIAEVLSPNHSVVTVLKGTIEVTRLEAGRLAGAATIVNALQRVSVTDRAPVSAPQPIAPTAARQLGQEFRLAPPRATLSAATAAVNAAELARAAADVAAVPRRLTVDSRLLAHPGDADDDEAHEGRGLAARENGHKGDRVRGHGGSSLSEALPALKGYGRAADAVNTVGEAMRSGDRGRRNRERAR